MLARKTCHHVVPLSAWSRNYVKVVLGAKAYDGNQYVKKEDTILNTKKIINVASKYGAVIYGGQNKEVSNYCRHQFNNVELAVLHPETKQSLSQYVYFMAVSKDISANNISLYSQRRLEEAFDPNAQGLINQMCNHHDILVRTVGQCSRFIANLPSSIRYLVIQTLNLPLISKIPDLIFKKIFLVNEEHINSITQKYLTENKRPMICASVYEFLKPKSILEINHALTEELKMIEHLSSSLTKIDKESVIISLRSWLIPGEELTMKEKIIQQITAIHELGFSQFVFDWEGVENQALILDVIRTINLENNDSNGKSIDIWATVRGRDKNGLLYLSELIKAKKLKLK